MSKPVIFRHPIPKSETERLAKEEFEDMVKFVVDLKRKVICVGGGLHSDEEQMLIEDGSNSEDLWGSNYYWQDTTDQRFEYTSMINIRPQQGNKSQLIQSDSLKQQVRELAIHYFESKR